MEVVVLLLALALPLVFPFLVTRTVLETTANAYADPRTPEAASGVRWAARICVATTLLLGLAFSAWCFYQAEHYQPRGFDLGALFYTAGGFVPVVPMVLVLIGVSVPVRVKFRTPETSPGFSRL